MICKTKKTHKRLITRSNIFITRLALESDVVRSTKARKTRRPDGKGSTPDGHAKNEIPIYDKKYRITYFWNHNIIHKYAPIFFKSYITALGALKLIKSKANETSQRCKRCRPCSSSTPPRQRDALLLREGP